MKMPLLPFMLIGSLLWAGSAFAQNLTTTTSPTVVNRNNPGFGLPDCNTTGGGCTVMVLSTTMPNTIITALTGGGYIMQVAETYMMGRIVRSGSPEDHPVTNRALMLGPGSQVRIVSSAAYPALNGRTIPIANVLTDVNGGYTIQFAP